jgi:Ca-activated chloride channel family protein
MQREPRGVLGRHAHPRTRELLPAAPTAAFVGAFVVAIALLAACAGSYDRPEPASGPQAGPEQADSSTEEVIVTGSRIEDAGDIRTLRREVFPREPVAQSGASAAAVAPAAPPVAAAGGQLMVATVNAFDSRSAQSSALARVQPGEEVWVIALSRGAERVDEVEDAAPGSGTMLAVLAGAANRLQREIPLPLKHTDVRAVVSGYVGTVDVKQQFTNPYDEKIEAVYLFPLPEKAAVSEFVMTIGERQIRGILREKEEAEQIYLDARAQGYRASLLTQHRPNIFEQKVANIDPGKQIDVDIRYFHTLAYEDGWYSFVFPTVVGPRYNPQHAADPVLALPRADLTGASGAAVRYLRPSERSAHDISIAVDVDAGVAIEELVSSHAIHTERTGSNTARVQLATATTIPNRDFVLRFRVAGDTIKSNLLTHTDDKTQQGYFTLMVYPPADLAQLRRQPVEMVFVLDTSGSMEGRPLQQASDAVAAALDGLQPNDTFQILNFSMAVTAFRPAPIQATQTNIQQARSYVRSLRSGGGTEMLTGIRAALSFPHDSERQRFVTFLTDGYIGNEAQIFAEVNRLIGSARIFSFGVGNSVNRYLLDGLAREGRGAVAYLSLEDSAREVMTFYFERISHPALTDVAIDWRGMSVTDLYPQRLPDLFAGRPIVVTGKFRGEPGEVMISGRAAGRGMEFAVAADESGGERSFIPNIWARLRIEDLANRQMVGGTAHPDLAREIRDTALEHGLMSQYTAFVAVDASERTAGERGTTVYQAVPVPDGVRYQTTVAGE